jgi:hypothetical protein
MSPQELAVIAQALAALRVQPADAYTQRLLAAAGQLLPSFTPDGLGMLAYSVAVLGADPPPAWRGALLSVAFRALIGGGCSARNLACLGLLLARWRADPGPQWWDAYFGASAAVMRRRGYCAQVCGLRLVMQVNAAEVRVVC